MAKFILATQNRHKVKEILKILGAHFGGKRRRAGWRGRKIKLLSLLDFANPPKIIENGRTFEANALKKARAVVKKYRLPSVADDSGLMVGCLDGAPGIKSARYAGPNPTKERLCRKLIREIEKVCGFPRARARFVCCIAIVWPDGREKVIRGEVQGHIINEMCGENGFGYDPVFVPRGYNKTFAQMQPAFKNRISHRARALKKAKRAMN